MAAWWYRNTSDSDDTHDALASVIAQRAASPRRKSTTGPGRTPPLSCDDAHSTSSKGGRADPAAIAAAAASSAAGAAPPPLPSPSPWAASPAPPPRTGSCSFKGASSCRPAALTLAWAGCPTAAREGGGNAVMKSARASADGPDSEQQPAWSWATCLRASSFHYRTNVEVCSPTPCRAKPFPSKPGDVAGRAE